MNAQSFKNWLLLVLVLTIIAAVSNEDYDSALKEQGYYCKMVADGLWPAYRKDINCGELK